MSVQISIVHYAEDEKLYFNDVLAMLVRSIRELTNYPYKLNIIDNEMPLKARKDLESKLPDIDIIRVPKHEVLSYPAGVNGAILNNKEDYLLILHTDVLVSWNWLESWVQNLMQAELKYEVPCASTCLLLPYPTNEGTKDVPWIGLERVSDECAPKHIEEFMNWHRIPWKPWRNLPIAVSQPDVVTDTGHQLGFYIASKEFWEEVGLHDETMTGTMDDLDMGIRALNTRCRLLISNRVWLHHIQALHASTGCFLNRDPAPFRRKWGEEVLEKLLDGSIWSELHTKQQEKYGK